MDRIPSSVLFACTFNAVRSPMAAAILSRMHGHRIAVDSVGVRAGELDGFVVAVMEEFG
ncbi:MAG: low molecular weight phosphatase family protein, partial [Rhodospirillales bacterium]|nr:low molecular weight phosphatase family protein [Rhodospirillales bacterium]